MGNINSVGYATCHWYRNDMKDSIDMSHIEDRADSLIVSKLGEKDKNVLSKQFWKDWRQLKEPKEILMFYIYKLI